MAIKWVCGVTTVQSRFNGLLPATLRSIEAAGFPEPRLFIDGVRDSLTLGHCTVRYPLLRTAGNWFLSLIELYLRDPWAERYAIFQDDIVLAKNACKYLQEVPYPERSYLNAYSFPLEEECFSELPNGWHRSGQRGKGAQALIFSQQAVMALVQGKYIWQRFQNKERGWRSIDGGICAAMNEQGWFEYIHKPSLCQHAGSTTTTMGNLLRHQSLTFPGEDFDCLSLLKSKETVPAAGHEGETK